MTLGRVGRALMWLGVVTALLAGCQVRATVDVEMDLEGAGTVTVSVGFDDAALARLGDPQEELALDDLAAAGWTVSPPSPEPDGFTWVRVSKPFTTPEDLDEVLVEVAGPDGMVRDARFSVDDSDGDTIYEAGLLVDLTGGLSALVDEELRVAFGGDPVAALVETIEAEEGRPVTEMVEVAVALTLDDQVDVVTAAPGDEPTALEVTKVVVAPPVGGTVGIIVVAVIGTAAIAAMLLAARTRFRSRAPIEEPTAEVD